MAGEQTRELLSELCNHCNQLGSARPTERRSAANNILLQLESLEVLNNIDENTDLRRKKALTWDIIFKKVELFVTTELDGFAQRTPAYLQKKQQEVVKLVRTLLKKADERGRPHLKGEDVVLHLMSILKEPRHNCRIGVEYCKLLKKILSVPLYECDITFKTWQDVIDTFVSFLVEKPVWLLNGRLLVANIMYLSIEGAATLYTVKGNKLFKFFEKIIQENWSDSNSQIVEYLLAALNAFVKSNAEDCRGQVCRLGETLFPLLLQMWRQTVTSSFKNQLIQFMRLQICAHHPLGAHEDDDGSWSSSVNRWKNCLQRLYEAIVADIDQLKNRVLRSSSTKLDPGFTSQFIELATDVFHQVFWAQTTYRSMQDTTPEPGAKRQKIELGWHAARDTLESNSENLVLLSWLQILAALFAKHPSSIPASEFHPFFSILQQLQTRHKRRAQLDSRVVDSVNPILKQIWTCTLRVVGIKHLTDCGFSLLTTLLKELVVPPDPEMFCVILGSGIPSRPSFEFLATYLQLYSLPENFQPASPLGLTEPSKGSYPLRHQLFNWLMPVDEEGDGTNDILTFWASKTVSRLPSMQLVAGVLVSLTQKFSTAIEIVGVELSVHKTPDACPQDTDAMLIQMQEVYLKSTFDEVSKTFY
ncbi:hypothetical protein OS493_009588 [Desmophyllum pertusum]|uniref:Telomere-length maintenance and DNA damage repair domain-containing protein n=1 Tax=Desmophyllum pertusum TaxID=174260 RepID=A0A9W9YSC6_9CNID|nr:hypothetical protein OS493_009588 [Desmophyllum pertusum]